MSFFWESEIWIILVILFIIISILPRRIILVYKKKNEKSKIYADIDDENRMLVIKNFYAVNKNLYIERYMIKYEKDFSLYEKDSSFGDKGVVVTNFQQIVQNTEYKNTDNIKNLNIDKVLFDNQNRIIVLISLENKKILRKLLLRYLSNGEMDQSFGNNGILLTTKIFDLITIDNKKRLLAMNCEFEKSIFYLTRYSENGNIDTTFGKQGSISFEITKNNVYEHYLDYLFVDNEGKIFVVSYIFGEGKGSGNYICRFLEDGSIDSTWGQNGVVYLDIPQEYTEYDIFYLLDEKLIVTNKKEVFLIGSCENEYNSILIVKYNQNGEIDKSFGENGFVVTHLSYYNENVLKKDYKFLSLLDAKIDDQGKILVSFELYDSDSKSKVGVIRYQTDGQVDPHFYYNGLWIHNYEFNKNKHNVKIKINQNKINLLIYSKEKEDFDLFVF